MSCGHWELDMMNSTELSMNTPARKGEDGYDRMMIHSILTNNYSIGLTLPREGMQNEEWVNCERPE